MKQRLWLKLLRKEKGLTQQDIADILNISRQHYSMIENGERNPSTKLAMRFGSILGFDWVAFFDGTEGKMLKKYRM